MYLRLYYLFIEHWIFFQYFIIFTHLVLEFKVQGICGNKKEAWLLSFGSESLPYHVSSGGVSGMFQQQVLSGVPEEPAGSRL